MKYFIILCLILSQYSFADPFSFEERASNHSEMRSADLFDMGNPVDYLIDNKDEAGFWLFAQDLETDHRISTPRPETVMCHIETVAQAKKGSCRDREHVTLASNIHCAECMPGLGGLPTNNSLDDLFTLTSFTQTPNVLSNPTDNPLREMTNEMLRLSNSFQIEAGVFISLIGHESAGFCKTARSHTNARGLGQITATAFREVKDQLFTATIAQPRASRQAQNYFRARAAEMGIPLNTLRDIRLEDLQEEHNWKINLFFAASIFKIALTDESRIRRRRSGSGAVNSLNQDDVFETALNRYNGASVAERNRHYSETICQYEKIYAPGFIDQRALPATPRTCRQVLRNNTCGGLGGRFSDT